MFEPGLKPRVFGMAPGCDFAAALVNHLLAETRGQPPETLARIRLIVNTRRMARRIRDLFDAGPALLLPQIQLVTDLGEAADLAKIPPAAPKLRRRLELVELVGSLLDQQPDLAARASLFDLADSLAGLLDEMQGEGVSPDDIFKLDVSDESGHWQRALRFLEIVQHYFGEDDILPDAEARQRMVIQSQIREWQASPPDTPVILAGSTGSRGSTHLLMQAVAQLPQGAVVLPGFDFDMPDAVWSSMGDALLCEDHPQYRFRKLMTALDIARADILPWPMSQPPNPVRNSIVSLALRPAPVTDQWLSDGPKLGGFDKAFQEVTLLEAAAPRQEALTIAMRLRSAVENGETAALITPDRMLTRLVSATLDRWNIIADDSAGLPLHLTATGRFLRHVAALFMAPLTAEALIVLLKHPLTHSGEQRGNHLLLAHELELHLRKQGLPFPDAKSLMSWVEGRKSRDADDWLKWVIDCFTDKCTTEKSTMSQRIETHITLANKISQGSVGTGEGALWLEGPGRKAREVVDELHSEAPLVSTIDAGDYNNLFGAVLSRAEVRNPDTPHPLVRIWGTLEARVQGVDLLILAGLNEGSWPEPPSPDPWLNRKMRNDVGLLLPERRIGLSAHDFQLAIAAPKVWLTRSLRSDDTETVPSRWLNRLTNMMNGLPEQGGAQALTDMRMRGKDWLEMARAFEEAAAPQPASRPAPKPPLAARPLRLSVTEIKNLVRDPYAIYAKHVLRLRPLNSLMRAPDALLRGTVLHRVFEEFVRTTQHDPSIFTPAEFERIAQSVLAETVAWPEMRILWLARLRRVSEWFIDTERARQAGATPVAFEVKGQATLPDLGFTLVGTADRIDRRDDGALNIYDYKTGAIPTAAQQRYFDKQLLLEAAIAELSGFGTLGPCAVASASYIGLGSKPEEKPAPLGDEPINKIWSEFHALIQSYATPDQPYVPRRMMHLKTDKSDYDQLTRFGEWNVTDLPVPEVLT